MARPVRRCGYANCERKNHAHGMCRVHYYRHVNGADMDAPARTRHARGSRISADTGERFRMLTVVAFSHVKRGANFYVTRCDCGKERIVDAWKLVNGTAISCGCVILQKLRARTRTHGRSRISDPTYRSWYSMKSRCNNRNDHGYAAYGARGIKVCEQWGRFETFLADMGDRPKGTSLDRYPNQNGNYEPGNCRWATVTQQQRNTRQNVSLTIGGTTRCVAEWAEIAAVPQYLIYQRVNRGWDASRAVFQPARPIRREGASK